MWGTSETPLYDSMADRLSENERFAIEVMYIIRTVTQ